ncbi:HD domain-containing phosphohydrolase [Comamonas guangdongensis]|uniref:HD domain-containing phosphohydrolase n=1 Tax=Comamonas guangdongensis TaxID=510515 RepID=A0ABV3ZWF0_9BURK
MDLAEAVPAGVFPSPAARILCVDDEPHIAAALRRLLRGAGHAVHLASSGEEALALLEAESIDLVISDMRMPGMDGAQLLARVRERWPAVGRVLLTGYADLQSTIAAINAAHVYRYLTKPWDDRELLTVVQQISDYQILQREKERLEAVAHAQNKELAQLNATLEHKVLERTAELSEAHKKLKKSYVASIRMFSNLLEWRGGPLAGHSHRVADLTRRTAKVMGLSESEQQDAFVAALIHDIGHITLPDGMLARPVPRLNPEELGKYRQHTSQGEQLLLAIDDAYAVATLVRHHHEHFDGSGYPDGLSAVAIPIGARILAVADTYDDLQIGHLSSSPLSPADARTMIAHGRGKQFDPEVVDAFLQLLLDAAPIPEAPPIPTSPTDLRPGMTLARDFLSGAGVVLLPAGHVLTAELIRRIQLRAAHEELPIQLPIRAS